jgi:hypothetical protein
MTADRQIDLNPKQDQYPTADGINVAKNSTILALPWSKSSTVKS